MMQECYKNVTRFWGEGGLVSEARVALGQLPYLKECENRPFPQWVVTGLMQKATTSPEGLLYKSNSSSKGSMANSIRAK